MTWAEELLAEYEQKIEEHRKWLQDNTGKGFRDLFNFKIGCFYMYVDFAAEMRDEIKREEITRKMYNREFVPLSEIRWSHKYKSKYNRSE